MSVPCSSGEVTEKQWPGNKLFKLVSCFSAANLQRCGKYYNHVDAHTHVHSQIFPKNMLLSTQCLKNKSSKFVEMSVSSHYAKTNSILYSYYSTCSMVPLRSFQPHTWLNLPPAVALVSPHQKLSWPPLEPRREEHFWACQLLHPSVRLQDPGASAPLYPGSWSPEPTRFRAAAPGPLGQWLSHVVFLHGVWHAGQWAPRHACAAQAPELVAAPADARGAYRPAGRTWRRKIWC